MKIDSATIQRLKEKIALYREFLKNWLEPSNLARLTTQAGISNGHFSGLRLACQRVARCDQLQYGRHDSTAAQ